MNIANEILIKISALAARRMDKEILMILRRQIKKLELENPELAQQLSRTMGSAGSSGTLRKFQSLTSLPVDADTGMNLLQYEKNPCVEHALIFPPIINAGIERFIAERKAACELRSAGVLPPSSLALIGPPGTGKSSLARDVARRLELPLFILNLASVLTSYLGQTGQNLKKALERAKIEPAVLLIDEFDAIAQTRLATDDVGEMKRIVTVLLQEVEHWPDTGVVIATTNIPEIIDNAFQRRFSRWIEIPLPRKKERISILEEQAKILNLPKEDISTIAICLENSSGADVVSFMHRVKSQTIVTKSSPKDAIMHGLKQEISERSYNKDQIGQLIMFLKQMDSNLTYEFFGSLFGFSHTTARTLKLKAEQRQEAPSAKHRKKTHIK